MPTLKSKQFILRSYRDTDAKDIAKNINNLKVSRYMTHVPYPYSLKDAKAFLQRIKAKNKKGLKVSLAIAVGKEVVGGITLMAIAKGHKAEMGYWLAPKLWGRGIMSEAVKKVVKYAFGKLKLKRVCAYVMIPNKGSQKVLVKAGFKKEGLLKKHGRKDGKFLDMYIYGKTK